MASLESDELYRALEHTPPETPVWVEVRAPDGLDTAGYLVESIAHEEVGIVLRIATEPFWRSP